MLFDCEFIRALVVANELSPATSAMRALEPCCIYVTTHADPHAALETARSKTFDVAVLDVELLGREVGPRFASFRVIPNLCMVALTASDDASERVRWLEAGADECITLPCESQELMARLRATVRCAHRDHFHRHRTLQVGRLSLSLESMCAEINGSRLELTTYEFALLWALARNSGKVLTREQLLDLAKGSAEDALDRSIDVQVSRLRSKLGDDPRHPRLLKTVRGVGYLLVPDSWSG